MTIIELVNKLKELIGDNADIYTAPVNLLTKIREYLTQLRVTVPMVILPPGVLAEVETRVFEIEPTVLFKCEATKHLPDGIEVANVCVIGSLFEPVVYIVETKRTSGGISLPLADRIAVIVEEAREQLEGKTTDGQIARIKAEAFDQINRLVNSR